LIVASTVIAVAAFVFNETVVVKAARQVTAWSDNDYRPVPPETGIVSNVWILAGDDLVRARHVGGYGRGFHAEGLTIYDRDGGRLQRIVKADHAVPQAGAWLLDKVTVYDTGMNLVRRVPQMTALPGVEPERLRLARVDPDQTDYFALKDTIAQMERAGLQTAEAQAGLAHKISGPLSTLLMPLLAAVAAFGLARSGQVLLRATIGMALGFAYFVADNFSLAMGNVGVYPPLLAAWAPFFLFLLIGETVLIQSEE